VRIQNDRHWSTRLECLATCQLFNPTIWFALRSLIKRHRQSSLDEVSHRNSQMTKARVPKLAGRTAGPSKQRTTSKSTTTPLSKPRTTLNDIPPESITYIAQILRSNRPKFGYGCQCEAQKKRIESRARVKGVSKWPATAWSDPSWAFSAVSKRYRRIVFHEDTTRRYSLGYSECCIQRVLAIPETIRANVS
jgi:hypothetical protein